MRFQQDNNKTIGFEAFFAQNSASTRVFLSAEMIQCQQSPEADYSAKKATPAIYRRVYKQCASKACKSAGMKRTF